MIRHWHSRQMAVLGLFVALAIPMLGCTPGPSSGSNSTGAWPPASPVSATETSVAASVSSEGDPLVLAQNNEVAPAVGCAAEPDPLDWPYCRGPEYNGISRETGLIDDWDPEGGDGSNLKWKRDDVAGRSTPIVMNGKLYTLLRAEPETPREGEKVVCLDAETGQTLWENRFNVWLSDVPDVRVGWSSVVGDPETGKVYALGVCGYFQCIDGETGKTLWSFPLHEKFGFLSTYGGRTNFPVIHEDLVIISAVVIGWGESARPAHRLVAFNKSTGEVVWFNGTRVLPYDTTYSSPTVTTLDGQKALVFGSSDGAIWALQPRTGKHIWQYRFSRRGLNVSPLVVGNRIFSGHSEENVDGTAMGSVVAIDGIGNGDITQSGEIWRIPELMMGKSSPLMVDGRLYCFDDRAKLHILDTNTGEPLAPRKALGTVMRGSPLYADGKIYAITANGRWYILKPDEKRGVDILSKGRFPSGEEVPASPICSHGRIYIQTTGGLYCLEDADKQHGATPRPPAPRESPVSDDQVASQVQIVPAESLMYPGRIQSFSVRLFNARGQEVGTADDVSFELAGPGQISSDGAFLAPTDAGHAATIVRARVGDLVGEARVRIVPPLPWTFDFDDLNNPPVTWVGARYRHVVREVDGSNAMVKITTIPKGTRSRCWMGHPELNNYTIAADVKGAMTDNKMPDIGLIAQGYTLDLQGASQKLQIRTWVTQLRMAETIDFPWKADTWYSMKLRVTVENDKALLRGKVWPRDEQEPQDWTIEATDEAPNRQGSPGLFGNAKDAELYLDNITITPNS